MKPLHDKLSQADKHRHFKHELGLVASEPKGGVSEKYRSGWDKIFGGKHERTKDSKKA